MSRIRLITGFIAIFFIYIAWNLFNPGVDYSDDNGLHSASPLHLPIVIPFMIMLLWYFLNWINVVNEWERRPVLRFGRYVRTLDPGISLLEPFIHRTLTNVSVQDLTVEVAIENLQTKDNVGIAVKGVVTYCITPDRVEDSVVKVHDVDDSVYERALTTITDEAAVEDLDHLLEHRDTFRSKIRETLIERVADWGVTVKAFELKDLSITDEKVAEAIAMKARAKKEGAAEVARADIQKQVALKLNEAAEEYTPAGRWLKGLETLNELARSASNNTIMLPTDLIEGLAKLTGGTP